MNADRFTSLKGKIPPRNPRCDLNHMNLERFRDYLIRFDWYYAYSDDHRVWSTWNAEEKRLKAFLSHARPAFVSLYNKLKQ